VAQDDIVSILTQQIDSGNLPHLLLYGPPGTGKTSTIVAAAKRMYGSAAAYSSMTLELNASDARGIDVSSSFSAFVSSVRFYRRFSHHQLPHTTGGPQ
jgi:DNA polymerase III delta prime subunit